MQFNESDPRTPKHRPEIWDLIPIRERRVLPCDVLFRVQLLGKSPPGSSRKLCVPSCIFPTGILSFRKWQTKTWGTFLQGSPWRLKSMIGLLTRDRHETLILAPTWVPVCSIPEVTALALMGANKAHVNLYDHLDRTTGDLVWALFTCSPCRFSGAHLGVSQKERLWLPSSSIPKGFPTSRPRALGIGTLVFQEPGDFPADTIWACLLKATLQNAQTGFLSF